MWLLTEFLATIPWQMDGSCPFRGEGTKGDYEWKSDLIFLLLHQSHSESHLLPFPSSGYLLEAEDTR